ncbi:MAG: serine/threonine protein kinase [Planctomycetota bacterium]
MPAPKDHLERKFGELAVEFGYLSQDSLFQALRQQHRLEQQQGRYIPLGELLRRNGALTEEQSLRILGLQTGCQQVGHYRLVRKLGSGGMGSVYEARQELLDRPVALKILSSHISSNKTAIEQFHREAQLVAKLDHPNIVAGIDVGVDRGVHYFAMELIRGQSLAHALLGGKRLRLDKTLFMLREIAAGLAHAYSRGVIHRDIKPGNILIYTNGDGDLRPHVKITDLGLAKTRLLTKEDRRNVGWNMGTPHYFAPEQSRGDHAQDFRVDIYALGMTAFRLLTGREPFEGMPYHAIRDAHLTSTLIHPADHTKEPLPTAVTMVLRCMTAKNPRDRYDSYDRLVNDLTALIDARPVSAAPLPDDAATIRQPRDVFKPGRRRTGSGTLPAAAASAANAASAGRTGHPSAATPINGKSHLVRLPSGFLERFKEGSDPRLRAHSPNHMLRVKRGSPITPVRGLAAPSNPGPGSNGAHGPTTPPTPSGANGANGANGPSSPDGLQSGTGTLSLHGLPGALGTNGTNGTHGTHGTHGANGANGKTHRAAKSSGSALVPSWLKNLLSDRTEAEENG